MSFSKLTDVESMFLGMGAGLIEVSIMQPTLYIKNSIQQGVKIESYHPKVLYRGYLASASNMAALTGLQFFFCSAVEKWVTGGKARKLSFGEAAFTGFMGGALTGPVCCYLELVMIQQQRFAGTFLNTPARIVSEYGPLSLMRGLVGATLREGLFTAGYLGVNPWLNEYCDNSPIFENKRLLGKFASALTSAMISGTISHPIDTFKTCMQGDVNKQKYKGILSTCKTIHGEAGVNGFFRGWFWRVFARQVPSFFILQESRLFLMPIMFPKTRED